MKTNKIIYWVATVLILAMMAFSVVGSLTNNPDGVKLMAHLQMPLYLGKFLAVLKILGIIAILTPGYQTLKEWAYAGFMFDLLGATYGSYAVGDPAGQWVFMFIFIALLACSYIYYHKILKSKATTVKDAVV